MLTQRKSSVFVLLIAINLFCSLSTEGFVCPPTDELNPCTCTVTTWSDVPRSPSPRRPEIEEGYINCLGEDVTQSNIDSIISAVRQVNNDTLILRDLQIARTGLTSINLTSVLGGELEHFSVTDNSNLSGIVGPPLSSLTLDPEDGIILIEAYDVDLSRNILDDEGLSTTLKYFEPTSVFYWNLARNRVRGDGGLEGELLPGLSNFTSLRYLGLNSNRVKRVRGAQLRKNRNLHEIELESNELMEVGDNSFDLEAYDDEESDFFSIYLRNNNLTETHLSPSGLKGTKRRAEVDLTDNFFTTIPQSLFLEFLEENQTNSLDFERNQIQCDPRVEWLKERRGDFENRVRAPCANDPGKTVFTSQLVDS